MTTAYEDLSTLRHRTRSAAIRQQVRDLADPQGGVVSRRQLRELGVPGWFVDEQVRMERWAAPGPATIAVHTGPLPWLGRCSVAVFELGPRAALSGVTVLQRSGVAVTGDGLIHVIVPKGAAPRQLPGVRVHESRRYRDTDVRPGAVSWVRDAAAVVHAALWSRTAREACLMLTMAVQNRLVTPAQLRVEVQAVTRHRHRKAMLQMVEDLVGGIRSLGELDVAKGMRARGLPEPARQQVRSRPSGTQYLDADFEEYEITMEIDGWQHTEAAQVLSDTLRDLDLRTEGRVVVRLPLIAWRLDEEAVLDALERLFRSRGWLGPT